jgi:hypothetical protein
MPPNWRILAGPSNRLPVKLTNGSPPTYKTAAYEPPSTVRISTVVSWPVYLSDARLISPHTAGEMYHMKC